MNRIEAERNKRKTKLLVEQVVTLLSLQSEESSAHQVEAYLDGVRVPVLMPTAHDNNEQEQHVVWAYMLPWSRGFSVFATNDDNAGAYSWRGVPSKYKGLSKPVYAPRGGMGPWRCDAQELFEALIYIVERLEEWRDALIRQQNKKDMYNRQYAVSTHKTWPAIVLDIWPYKVSA